jgi:hypothetical protein
MNESLRDQHAKTALLLNDISDSNLPNHANSGKKCVCRLFSSVLAESRFSVITCWSGLRHRGLPHGNFAWYIRIRPRLLKLWQSLYPGQVTNILLLP